MNSVELKEAVGDTTASVEDERPAFDFSNEPIFGDASAEPVKCEVPGKPGNFITVKPFVDFAVSQGRARFAEQRQRLVRDARTGKTKPDPSMSVTFDSAGLFNYKVRNCLASLYITDPVTSKEYTATTPSGIEDVFKRIKSDKFAEWVTTQIDRVLGWDKEGDEALESFREQPS